VSALEAKSPLDNSEDLKGATKLCISFYLTIDNLDFAYNFSFKIF
jgi:hypothetical protein